MEKNKIKIFSIIIVLLFFFIPLTGEKKSAKDLPLKHNKWLEEEAVYIITPKEKDVFLQLETDRERDLFIEAFWKQRDPTPGTPENEYKIEHYRRINYANQRLGVGSPKPGWRTDRGRIYIILGEPFQKDSYSSLRELWDTEIWFYQDMTRYGLPQAFYVVFYRKGFGGDFELYSPNSDGPQAFFIQNPQIDPADYIAFYAKLKEINPSIAEVSLSLIPGEPPEVSGRPSLASDILLQNINVAPQKEIKDLYAENFLKYKGIVEVEYSINYIESDYLVQTIKDDSGMFFVHYLIEPKRLSIGQYEKTYYSHFILNGNATDLEGKLIYQFEKEYSLNFDEDRIKSMAYTPLQINDMFPLIPGNYNFSLLLKNTVSKEFSSFEKTIFIPDKITTPEMSSLLLCYGSKEMDSSRTAIRPFQIGQKLFFTQPKNIFLPSEKMTIYFQLYSLSDELIKTGKIKYSFVKRDETIKTFSRNIREYSDPRNILEEISLSEFTAANYTLKVSLQDQSGQDLLFKSEYFSISPVTSFPRPLIQSKALPASNDAINNFRIGTQLFNKGKYEEASIEFEKALIKKPEEMDFAIHLAKTYFVQERYMDVESILTPFLKKENIKYEVYFYLGKAAQIRGNFKKAISHFKEAISHFGLNIYLLNALGECYLSINEIKEARTVWEKSLEIIPNQPQIKEKLASIKGKK
ncbi:MAG: GWxTD domain-containing protein [Candidatus Aminicenantes bacterium]|nr:GWxTD domain-containing protein [Candidatus Aminicenantes bacterium]